MKAGRRAAVLTAGLAGLAAYQAVTVWRGTLFEPAALAAAAGLGLAVFGFTRRSLHVQVASRGMALLGCAPLVVRVATGATPGAFELASFLLALAALWLGRPLLDTEEARAAFAPARFRGAFLAGATTMTAAAAGAAAYAVAGVAAQSPIMIAFNAGLAVLLLVAVRALLAMRTWGLLLGALVSVALVALTPLYGPTNAVTLGLAAAPALLLWVVPLVLAWRKPAPAPEIQYRVAAHAASSEREEEVEEEEEEETAGRRAHLAR
ncbi:MAG: hypothetical protein KIT84_39890 [Labilithrix sp.]|nr:hypothetical protein [Labilithrix sp.]MCW5817227.1 hypothetical protein [Labilithrix sp.]